MQDTWNNLPKSRSLGEQIYHNLNATHLNIERWRKHERSIELRIRETCKEIKILESKDDSLSLTEEEGKRLTCLHNRTVALDCQLYHKRWTIAKTQWIWEGNLNTKFFYRVINYSRTQNHISHIILDYGTRIRGGREITQQFVTWYKNLCGVFVPSKLRSWWDCPPLPQIPSEKQDNLLRRFTFSEIHGALNQIGLGKRPGSDGFIVEFF